MPNDLLVLIDYILRFFSENNRSVNEIQQIRQTIISENERMMNHEKYFKLKRSIIRKVSSGFTNSAYHQDDLYTVIAQRYENLEQETEEHVQRALTQLAQSTQRRRQNNIATQQSQIQQGIISH